MMTHSRALTPDPTRGMLPQSVNERSFILYVNLMWGFFGKGY